MTPAPSATFSALTTQNPISSSSFSEGRRSSTAARPGVPKTSATKRIFSGSYYGKESAAAPGWTDTATWLPAFCV